MLATLMLSFGIPMLLGGDELGRTQQGNNNAYCQDNEITWFDWAQPDADLLAFTKQLIALRKAHPVFRRNRFLAGAEASELRWFTPAGTEMTGADWADPNALAIALYLDGSDDPDRAADGTWLTDDDFLVLVNAWWEPLDFTLPDTRPRRDGRLRSTPTTPGPRPDPRPVSTRRAITSPSALVPSSYSRTRTRGTEGELIILLPAGFTAGALTTDVNPQRLLGPAFQPLVSLAVAVILYDSGLALEWGKVQGRARRVVPRLVIWGVPITMAFAAVLAGPLLGMSGGAALMTGAILVVSGPTVVTPLLAFVRPSDRLQRILSWEGSLIDPVGGILGAVVFHAVLASTSGGIGHPLGQFLLSLGIGVAGAAAGVAVLWVCLCKLDLDELLATTAQLATVVGVAAACDIVRDDAGLIAAVLMGLAVANLRVFHVPAKRPFFETLVQLIIGVLFVSISATVTPASLQHLVLPTIALVAVLVLVTRPLVAFLATIRTELTRGERAFTGWMAPRGIVAAATATTFGATLAASHVGGASKILPVTFLVIVATVALYGLTAVPVARRLGVTRPARTRPLLVGATRGSWTWPAPSRRPAWTCSCGPRPGTSATRSAKPASNSPPASSSPRPPGRAPTSKASPPSSCSPARTTTTPWPPPPSRATPKPPSRNSRLPARSQPRRGSPLHSGRNALRPHPHPPGPDRPLRRRCPHHHPVVRRRDPPGHRLVVPDQPRRHPDPGNNLSPPRPPAGRHPRGASLIPTSGRCPGALARSPWQSGPEDQTRQRKDGVSHGRGIRLPSGSDRRRRLRRPVRRPGAAERAGPGDPARPG